MDIKILLIIATIAIANFLTRFFPYFIMPRKVKIPKYIEYLSNTLPSAIIAALVVYCLKDIDFEVSLQGFKEFIAIGVVVILQLIFKIPIISIAGGVGVYMAIIQI